MRESFNSKEDFMATTFHEMIHSTGHESRLNREEGMIGELGSKEYAREELVAELGSVFLQSKLGVKLEGQHFDNHSAYINSWIEILKNDPNEVFRAASKAEKASEYLHERYLEHEQEQLKALENAERIKPHALDSFSVYFHDAETGKATKDLNFEEERRYRSVKAYEFIEKVIKFDKDLNDKRELREDIEKSYYKSWMTINLKGYSTGEIRIDLGDREFGGYEKVSDALEHRLKSHPNELLNRKEEYAKNFNVTTKKIEEDLIKC